MLRWSIAGELIVVDAETRLGGHERTGRGHERNGCWRRDGRSGRQSRGLSVYLDRCQAESLIAQGQGCWSAMART